MLLGKKKKLGRMISEMGVGEKLTLTEKMEDRDLLLYLGLTNDANPLYIQHDYASQTPFKKPIVPSIMLNGIIHSAVSKYLPGPGAHVMGMDMDYPVPVYHYGTVHFLFTVSAIDIESHLITIDVQGENEDEEVVVRGNIRVCPPHKKQKMSAHILENF
ncbi:MaoC/PaaZ C-terminal domain-containing protein [Bacillus sp. 2205SS5-2]|uniref:MaoC/PaaZ C-terminal domain-containing protein n=1 Tax=Bacillus sp. 2205SS5-2 TaxID=3109031 RepID=UPI00300616D6